MTKKEKKITVKHYLNRELKPMVHYRTGEVSFPVYTKIIFDRKNTQFRLWEHYFTIEQFEECFENKEDDSWLKEIEDSELLINKIIRKEHKELGDSFKLHNIKNRIEFYSNYTTISLGVYLYDQIFKILEENFSKKVATDIFDSYIDRSPSAIYSAMISDYRFAQILLPIEKIFYAYTKLFKYEHIIYGDITMKNSQLFFDNNLITGFQKYLEKGVILKNKLEIINVNKISYRGSVIMPLPGMKIETPNKVNTLLNILTNHKFEDLDVFQIITDILQKMVDVDYRIPRFHPNSSTGEISPLT